MDNQNSIEQFYNKHTGQTCIYVGNGPSLQAVPTSFLTSYPTIGVNTIHLRTDFTPTYYTAVDSRVMFEFGEAVYERFKDVPKFIPRPNLDKWKGNNFYRFYHRPGILWPRNNEDLWPRNILSDTGITYSNITHVAWQLLYFMGFSKILCVGMDHFDTDAHFWGNDNDCPGHPSLITWEKGYKILLDGFAPRTEIVNISSETKLDVIPREDYRKYYKNSKH